MSKYRAILFLFMLCTLLCLSCPTKAHHATSFGFAGTAGPIITNPATTLPKGRFAFGYRHNYINFNEFSVNQLKFFAKKKEFLHNTSSFHSLALIGAYGLTNDLTFAVRLPYNSQSEIFDRTPVPAPAATIRSPNFLFHHVPRHIGKPATIRRGTSDGLGDLTIFTQYRLLNLKDKLLEAALIAGINIPSGIAHVKDATNTRFGADHQPSHRSFDPIIGASVTKYFGERLSFDVSYLFTKSVRGIQKHKSGDLHNYNTALSYRLLESHHHHDGNGNGHVHEHKHIYGQYFQKTHIHEHPHKHKWYSIFGLDGIIELNGEWRQKQKFKLSQGGIDENSGGTVIYVSPGLRLVIGENWSAYFSFGIPAIQDPSGKGQRNDFRIVYGVGFVF